MRVTESGLYVPAVGDVYGHGTVELFDERTGRRVHRVPFENMIAWAGVEMHKGLIRNAHRAQGGLGILRRTDVSPADLFHGLFCTDYTGSENFSYERSLIGNVVAYSFLSTYSGADTKRGGWNLTESIQDGTKTKWVFDFPTSAGNGTFQSIGWCNTDSGATSTSATTTGEYYKNVAAAFPMSWNGFADSSRFDRAYSSNPTTTQIMATPDPTNIERYWTVDTTTTPNTLKQYVTPAESDTTAPVLQNSVVLPTGATGAAFSIATNFSDGYLYVVAATPNPEQVYVVDPVALTNVRNFTLPAKMGPSFDTRYIAFDASGGCWLYEGGQGTVKKINTTTGAVLATVTLPTSLWPSGFPGGQQLAAVADPLSGQHIIVTGSLGSTVYARWFDPLNPTLVMPCGFPLFSSASNVTCGFVSKNGRWRFGTTASPTVANAEQLVRLETLGSRTLLASPVTKVSTHTMKITYEFDY